MQIGICDDSPRDCLELKNMISAVRKKDRIVSFSTGEEMIKALESGAAFDVLFLDIYLPDMQGTQLAEKIVKADSMKQTFIVFVTTSPDYAVQAFALRAVHYLVKPIQKEDVIEVFERIPHVPVTRCGISVTFRDSSRFLYLDEIMFCESFGHKVFIYLNTGESVVYYQSLKSLSDQLGTDFLQITRGLLVNMDYIEMMKGASCVLKNGREVLLSRRNRKEIKDAYNKFVFSRLLSQNGSGTSREEISTDGGNTKG